MIMHLGTSTLFPLTVASEGDKIRILYARVEADLAKRLSGMGLFENSEWEVIQRKADGAIVIRRESARLALGAGIAERIMGILVWSKITRLVH